MTLRRLLPVASILVLALAGCGGSEDKDPSGTTNSPTDVSDSTAASTSSEPTPTEASEATESATCNLKGKKPTKVTLEATGDALVATFDGQPVPDKGTVLYSVFAYDKSGNTGVQLGMKYLDGEQIAYFVFDESTVKQANLDGSPEVSGKTVRGTFPDAALGDLSETGVGLWGAGFSLNGNDLGLCPGGYDLLPFPS